MSESASTQIFVNHRPFFKNTGISQPLIINISLACSEELCSLNKRCKNFFILTSLNKAHIQEGHVLLYNTKEFYGISDIKYFTLVDNSEDLVLSKRRRKHFIYFIAKLYFS